MTAGTQLGGGAARGSIAARGTLEARGVEVLEGLGIERQLLCNLLHRRLLPRSRVGLPTLFVAFAIDRAVR
jgi:hypothetical protein